MSEPADTGDKPTRSARSRRREIFFILFVIALSPYALSAMSWKRPKLGLVNGRLRACPNKPNCVCSEYKRLTAYVAPLDFDDEPDEAWRRLQSMIDQRTRIKVVETGEDYIRVECTSRILRFVDDLEFRLDRKNRVIHMRSSSRIGYSDLGVNGRRVEEIRAAFKQTASH